MWRVYYNVTTQLQDELKLPDHKNSKMDAAWVGYCRILHDQIHSGTRGWGDQCRWHRVVPCPSFYILIFTEDFSFWERDWAVGQTGYRREWIFWAGVNWETDFVIDREDVVALRAGVNSESEFRDGSAFWKWFSAVDFGSDFWNLISIRDYG